MSSFAMFSSHKFILREEKEKIESVKNKLTKCGIEFDGFCIKVPEKNVGIKNWGRIDFLVSRGYYFITV